MASPCVRQVPAAKSRIRGIWFEQRYLAWDMKRHAHSLRGMAEKVERSERHAAELGPPTDSVLHTRSCPHPLIKATQIGKPLLPGNYCLGEAALNRKPQQPCLGDQRQRACPFPVSGYLGKQVLGPLKPRKSKCLHDNAHRGERQLWRQRRWCLLCEKYSESHAGCGLVVLGSHKSEFGDRWR